MSSESASVMNRLSDILRKYLRKLIPSAVKMSFYYDVGQSFEKSEESLAHHLLDLASRIYEIFNVSESLLYEYYKSFIKDLIDLSSAIEDALSFTSLYMNLLVVFAMLLMVFLAWRPQ
ncbi:MAG: hypothetical protein ACP5KB_00755 [Thermoprotei archaeon]